VHFKLKPLSSFSALALTTAMSGVALTACRGGEGEGSSHSGEGESALSSPQSAEGVATPHSEGEGEGAGGEGGESEGASNVNALHDNVAFLTQLGLMRGHLHAFYALYSAGELANAATHAKHPESELYADLAPALAAREIEGFATPLTTLSNVARDNGEIDAAYAEVVKQITRVERASEANAKEKLLSISNLIRIAGDEYKIGVASDGAITNLHEYQDAYGFVEVAKDRLSTLNSANELSGDVIGKSIGLVTALSGNFDGWTPKRARGKSNTLYGAAARIELLALGLE